ncbi:MAG: 4-carboxy-4-hydroxy-2-oxoadipate aldolase/oxaloacetate decarboxylase [Propionibacteriales bacterium]|nr:4-carboxy-4-hydroxy-2-oxoadipate aldolase/oxaloacetate decarboxylase [Propionibacteriales bacterium]
MGRVIITGPPRASLDEVDRLQQFGVATIHEAIGRVGLLDPRLRPIQTGVRVAGTAVTVKCWPGDNLMIHAAVEQCRPGDLLVVTTTSESTDGVFGELLATSFQSRGVRGLVTTTGVRDTEELRSMSFPVWSAAVSAQGTVKATAGSVNVPVAIGRTVVRPGDVVVADEDGIVLVPRRDTAVAIEAATARVAKEEQTRAALAAGELGLDRYGLRSLLADLGVEYRKAAHDD